MSDHGTTPASSVDDRLSRLIEAANELCAGEEHRREPLVERGEAHGLGRGTAERAYDVAVEESLPPAYGIAVAVAGISVRSPGARSHARATDPTEPEWVDQPPEAAEAVRERRMRQTFRRVRSFLAGAPTPRDAFAAFAGEPDLESFDY